MHKTARFLILSLIVGGATEKVSQFIMPLMSVYNKLLCLNEQKCIFEHRRKIKPIKISYNCIISVFKISPVYLSCAALFELLFVLY